MFVKACVAYIAENDMYVKSFKRAADTLSRDGPQSPVSCQTTNASLWRSTQRGFLSLLTYRGELQSLLFTPSKNKFEKSENIT